MVSCHSRNASASAVVTMMASRAGDGRHRSPAGTGAPASSAGVAARQARPERCPSLTWHLDPPASSPENTRGYHDRPRCGPAPPGGRGRGAGAGLVRARSRGVQKAQRPVAARGAASDGAGGPAEAPEVAGWTRRS